jgi:hypothetical protein
MWIRSLRTVTLLFLTLASLPVYAQKVTYDWDKDVDFSPYRTYKWIDPLPGKASVETTHKRIVGIVDLQMQAKDLNLTSDAHADLYVSYQVITDKNGPKTFNPDGQWKPGLGLDSKESKPPAGTMAQGALIIDLYDQKMKKLVWRGTLMGAFDSRQAVNYTIDKGLSKLFSYFPPPTAK